MCLFFFNDVQYIRRGWINRNRISEDFYITVPVKKAPQETLINQIKIDNTQNWHAKQCRALVSRYGKKSLDHPLYQFYESIEQFDSLLDLLKITMKNTCEFLNIRTEFLDSESFNVEPKLKGKDRIFDICQKYSANQYINLPGGSKLYSKEEFATRNIELEFLDISSISNFMSILDVCIGDGATHV